MYACVAHGNHTATRVLSEWRTPSQIQDCGREKTIVVQKKTRHHSHSSLWDLSLLLLLHPPYPLHSCPRVQCDEKERKEGENCYPSLSSSAPYACRFPSLLPCEFSRVMTYSPVCEWILIRRCNNSRERLFLLAASPSHNQ
jgi:hypothetical protein